MYAHSHILNKCCQYYSPRIDGNLVDPADDIEYECFRLGVYGANGLRTAYIKLPSNGKFNGNIQGMCGSYDGDPDTDYIDRNGKDHFDHPNTDNKVGNGWKCQKNKEVHR